MISDQELVTAVQNGNTFAANEALRQGADIRSIDCKGLSLLQIAEKNAQNNLVGFLVENGADHAQIVNQSGDTLLHRAARTGNFGFAKQLLLHGAQVNVGNRFGHSPLHLAVAGGHSYLAGLLLEHQADPNAKTTRGDTPLHIAARQGNIEISKGLAPGTNVSTTNRRGRTPLDEAASTGNLPLVSMLLDKGNLRTDDRADVTRKAWETATKYGQSELAEFLYSNYPISTFTRRFQSRADGKSRVKSNTEGFLR